jgi:hypothetical protein
MTFRTKLDFSNNRQIKQHIETLTLLSGATSFGVPFGDLPTGPDLTTTGITSSIVSGITSTFSGNPTTTIFTWGYPNMEDAQMVISAITPSNSADTQTVGPVFGSSATTIIDGNLINISYSGVGYDLVVNDMIELGVGLYSGEVTTFQLDFYSASTLDFTGRTIWADVSGITRTDRLIIKDNPTIGYVWTCLDSEGMGYWSPNFSGSGATSLWSASTGTNSLVPINSDLIASGDYSIAIGLTTIASGIVSYAEGLQTIASGDGSHAEGYLSQAIGEVSHAEGNSIASGMTSHSEGNSTQANGTASHAEGSGTVASGGYSHAEGSLTTASGEGSHAEGDSTTASGDYSHSEGSGTVASGGYSHAEGVNSQAQGYTSHAQGYFTIASGDYGSHSEGYSSVASGEASHSEGRETLASGINSHAEGYQTVASGDFSHAEGVGSSATTVVTHAEGNNTLASGFYSHAEGQLTQATGTYSHAEGQFSIASGNGTHAEGTQTIASGVNSHSQGYQTVASGDFSHAGGSGSTASGIGGFVYGRNSLSNNTDTFVLGRNMTGSTADTTYVDRFNIKTVAAGPGITDLGVDAGGNVVDQASDFKLKENINTIGNALDTVLALRGVTYNWKDRAKGGDALKLGFIAQEVHNVIPELAYYNPNGDYMGVHYKDVTALLVEAVKELVNDEVVINKTYLETQTILAEDNNIELNYNGDNSTAINGGIKVLYGKVDGESADLTIDENGNWVTNTGFEPKSLTLPQYTPTSSQDTSGKVGNVTSDDNYLYIKTINGWKRTNLETF